MDELLDHNGQLQGFWQTALDRCRVRPLETLTQFKGSKPAHFEKLEERSVLRMRP